MRLLASLAALVAAPLLASAFTPKPVPAIQMDAMMGRWYQVYTNRIVLDTIEKGGFCQTIDYAKTAAGVTVKNSMNFQIPGGMVMSLDGKVTQNPKEPGKFTEQFDMFPTPVSWWVIKLGPVVEGQYDYLVATDDKGQMLFVLARDIKAFKAKYDEQVIAYVEEQGFMGPRFGPEKTEHSAECQYAAGAKKPAAKGAKGKGK